MNNVTHITDGSHNSVVRDHPGTCHHCGFLVGEVKTCRTCGVRAHPECVTLHEDQCDVCRLGVAMDAVCEVCGVPDTVTCDTDRLCKCVAFYGHRWEPTTLIKESDVILTPDHTVSVTLLADSSATFLPHQLPGEGSRRMIARTDDGNMFVSKPFVAHTWCVQSSFQQIIPNGERPGDRVEERWRCLIENLGSPSRASFAETNTMNKVATSNDESPCCFCGSTNGYRSFCYAHTNCTSHHGCTTCNWAHRPQFTYTCFHPSCAVRNGMTRIVGTAGNGSGMMCHPGCVKLIKTIVRLPQRNKERHLMAIMWMEASSGLHMDLLNALPSIIAVDSGVRHGMIRYGHTFTEAPVTRKRAPKRTLIGETRETHGTGDHVGDVTGTIRAYDMDDENASAHDDPNDEQQDDGGEYDTDHRAHDQSHDSHPDMRRLQELMDGRFSEMERAIHDRMTEFERRISERMETLSSRIDAIRTTGTDGRTQQGDLCDALTRHMESLVREMKVGVEMETRCRVAAEARARATFS